MKKDPFLDVIVNRIEEGEYSEKILWVVVPGAVFAGEVITSSQYLREFRSMAAFDIVNSETRERHEFSLPDYDHEGSDRETSTYLHMRNLVLLSGGRVLKMRHVRVKLDAVIAWGFSVPLDLVP